MPFLHDFIRKTTRLSPRQETEFPFTRMPRHAFARQSDVRIPPPVPRRPAIRFQAAGRIASPKNDTGKDAMPDAARASPAHNPTDDASATKTMQQTKQKRARRILRFVGLSTFGQAAFAKRTLSDFTYSINHDPVRPQPPPRRRLPDQRTYFSTINTTPQTRNAIQSALLIRSRSRTVCGGSAGTGSPRRIRNAR